jgi:hypothetical protein
MNPMFSKIKNSRYINSSTGKHKTSILGPPNSWSNKLASSSRDGFLLGKGRALKIWCSSMQAAEIFKLSRSRMRRALVFSVLYLNLVITKLSELVKN